MNTPNSNPDTVTIQLTKGQQTVISAVDADLAEFKWCVHIQKRGLGTYYTVQRSIPKTPNDWSAKTSIFLSRMILERLIGRALVKGEFADHINGDSLDNRRENLRLTDVLGNNRNRGKGMRNTSGYKGVFKAGKRWRARINVLKDKIHLGCFDTPEEAYAAYCEAAKKYHGEFANFG